MGNRIAWLAALTVAAVLTAATAAEEPNGAEGENKGEKTGVTDYFIPGTGQRYLPLIRRAGIDRGAAAGLDRRITEIDFRDVPLKEALEKIARESGTNIWADWKMLKEAGIEESTTVNLRVAEVSLDRALALVLLSVKTGDDLGFVVTDEGVVIVSSVTNLSEEMVVRVYDVREILEQITRLSVKVGQKDEPGATLLPPILADDPQRQALQQYWDALETLLELTRHFVNPSSWAESGGLGELRGWCGNLVVRQSLNVHGELEDFLQELQGELQRNLSQRSEEPANSGRRGR